MALFQINSFKGALTRKTLGTMNSGLIRIGKSHSVNPFANEGALVFNEQATNLDPTHATFTDIVVDSVTNVESGQTYLYSIDRSGVVYRTNTSTDATTVLTNTLNITLKYGGGIKIISKGGVSNAGQQFIIAHDNGALLLSIDGTSSQSINNVISWTGTQANVSASTDKIDSSNLSTSATAAYNWQSLWTGMAVQWVTSGGNATPLVSGTTYYLIVNENFNIQLATSQANAYAGIQIDITAVDPSFSWILVSTGPTNGWIPNIPHPISDEFYGGIFIGNGVNLFDFAIAAQSSKNSRLAPTIPKNYVINSIEVDGQGRYMRINSTTGATQDVITVDPATTGQAPLSRTVYWNGSDNGYDSYDPLSQTNTTAAYSFVGGDATFGQDFFGTGIFMSTQGNMQKLDSIKELHSPLPGAVISSGSLLFFAAPYFVQSVWRAGLFCYGILDMEDQPALYQLLGIQPATSSNTICTAVGMIRLVQNRVIKSDGTLLTNSKMYLSTYETGGTAKANMYSFTLTPNGGTPNDGIYETNIEQFQLMQQVDLVTTYLQATQSGVSFKLELVDVDGTVPSGGSFTYTYASGTDETLLQGALEQIEWKPDVKNFQAMGLRITQLGTVQPNIYQVYVNTHDTTKDASS